jgi:LSD1 subclass zinc finger protein
VLKKPLRCPQCRLLMLSYTDGEKYVRCYNPDCRPQFMMGLDDYYATVTTVAAGITEGVSEAAQ